MRGIFILQRTETALAVGQMLEFFDRNQISINHRMIEGNARYVTRCQ